MIGEAKMKTRNERRRNNARITTELKIRAMINRKLIEGKTPIDSQFQTNSLGRIHGEKKWVDGVEVGWVLGEK